MSVRRSVLLNCLVGREKKLSSVNVQMDSLVLNRLNKLPIDIVSLVNPRY